MIFPLHLTSALVADLEVFPQVLTVRPTHYRPKEQTEDDAAIFWRAKTSVPAIARHLPATHAFSLQLRRFGISIVKGGGGDIPVALALVISLGGPTALRGI